MKRLERTRSIFCTLWAVAVIRYYPLSCTKPNIGWRTYLDGTVGSRDAAVERTGRYSQRVSSRYVGYLMYSLVTANVTPNR